MSEKPGELWRDAPELPLKRETRELFAFTNPERFPLSLPDEELAKHIKACRDKVYARISYPCLGLYRFLKPGSRENDAYDHALARIKQNSDRRILDMGCGYAQDIRAWIQSGVPSQQIVGADLLLDFVDDSFELFGDKKGEGHLAGVTFHHCDIFNEEQVNNLKKQSHEGKGFDVIYVGSFLHLFDWDGQTAVAHALSRLLSDEPGSLLFGRQSGMPPGKAGHYNRQHKTGATGDNSKSPWRHDPDSFARLWNEEAQGRSGAAGWDVRATLPDRDHNWAGFTADQIAEAAHTDPSRAYGTGLEFVVTRK